jgi:glyoxylase-like metal-dependent hydrolase (beta-lactamase superfamily II)
LTLTLAALFCGAAATAQTPPPAALPDPLVRPEDLTRVSAHVQVIPDKSLRLVSNIGFIVGSKAVLVVDTGLGPKNGATVYETARKLAGRKAIYLVATHAHPEHDLGAQSFPVGTTFFRSADQAAEKDNDLAVAKTFAAGSPVSAALLQGAVFREADVTFANSRRVDLGGLWVTLTALGPAHTNGDTVVWVEGDRVLFAGDLAMKAQPAITTPKATLDHWRNLLGFMEALKPAVVVPSHGPIGDAAYIRTYRAYLDEVGERTRAAKAAGASADAAAETVWQAMSARYPDRGRLGMAVRMVYAEAR